MFSSKYGVARIIHINVPKAGSANHAVGADWTPAAGDVKISKDGGAAANVTNLPTAIAMGNSAIWAFSLTATEMQAANVNITVSDSATKAVDDTGFVIETYGHASAQHEFDLDTSTVVLSGVTHTGAVIPTVSAVTGLTAATVHSDLDDIQARLPAALVNGRMDSRATIVGSGNDTNGANVLNYMANSFAFGTVGVGSTTTSVVLSSTTPAATVANQFKGRKMAFLYNTLTGALQSQECMILSHTAPSGSAITCTVTALTDAPASTDTVVITGFTSLVDIANSVLTTQMTESYRATNAAPTLAQALFETIGHLGESSIVSTTKTVKKLDGATTAKTYTLNDATTPTSITETT